MLFPFSWVKKLFRKAPKEIEPAEDMQPSPARIVIEVADNSASGVNIFADPGDLGDLEDAAILGRAAFILSGNCAPGLPAFLEAASECGDKGFARAFASEVDRVSKLSGGPAVRASKTIRGRR